MGSTASTAIAGSHWKSSASKQPDGEDEVDSGKLLLQYRRATQKQNKENIFVSNQLALNEAKRERERYDQHPELAGVLKTFDVITSDLKTKQGREHYEVVGETLIEDVSDIYHLYTSSEQRVLLGDYLAKIDFGQTSVDYYLHVMVAEGIDHITEDILDDTPHGTPMTGIRSALWNYSDCSVKLCEKIVVTGFFEHLMKDLRAMHDNMECVTNDTFSILSCMGILHNCARGITNRQIYRDVRATEHLIPFLKCAAETVKMVTLLILAYTIDENQNDLLLADDNVFDFLLMLLMRAISMDDHRYDGFSAHELMEGLAGLAQNDKNKVSFVEKGALGPVMTLLKTGDESEKHVAVKVLWVLSFDQGNKKKICENTDALTVVTDLLEKTNHSELKTACSGALFVLRGQDEMKEKAESQKNNGDTKSESDHGDNGQHVMISYNWDDQRILVQVRDRLKSEGFRVWMDIDSMGGSTLQAMAEAVENAAVILVCMSERYKGSPNCRTEAEYSFQRRKDIVPLLMQRKYQPDGWLGAILGAKLFFDFSKTKYSFDQTITQLVKELGGRGKGTGHLPISEPKIRAQLNPVLVTSVDVASAPKQPYRWTSEEVLTWLVKNRLEHLHTLKKLTGEQLVFLQKLANQVPEYFFSYIERKLDIVLLEDLMRFANAVERL